MKLTKFKAVLAAALVAVAGVPAYAEDAPEEVVATGEATFWLGGDEVAVASGEGEAFWLGPDEIVVASDEKEFWLGPKVATVTLPAGVAGYSYVVSNLTAGAEIAVSASVSGGATYELPIGAKVGIYAVPAAGYVVSGTNPYVIDEVTAETTIDANDLPKAEKVLTPVAYLDWDGEKLVETNTTDYVVYSNQSTLTAGTTYVVTGEVSRTSKITVNGTPDAPTYLILCDGAKLTAKRGIVVQSKNATINALIICAQENGTGALEATVDSTVMSAGIGCGNSGVPGGSVTINGGVVAATGGRSYPGIGGGSGGAGGTVTINGGVVTANGGEYGAGIGGGSGGAGGSVTINGGTVTATGGASAAGIGGGSGGAGGTVTINDGVVTATGGKYGAGIGGGSKGAGGTVTINGGAVTATGGNSAAGIGGGSGGAGGTVTINGGEVTATAGTDDEDGPTVAIGGGQLAEEHGAVTFGEGAWLVLAGDAAPGEKTTVEAYVADHSAKYAHIEPLPPEVTWLVGSPELEDATAWVDEALTNLAAVVIDNGMPGATNAIDLVTLTNKMATSGYEPLAAPFNALIAVGKDGGAPEYVKPVNWIGEGGKYATLEEALAAAETVVVPNFETKEAEIPAEIVETGTGEDGKTYTAVVENKSAEDVEEPVKAVYAEGLLDIATNLEKNVKLEVTPKDAATVESGVATALSNKLEEVSAKGFDSVAFVDLSVLFNAQKQENCELDKVVALHIPWPVRTGGAYGVVRMHGEPPVADAIPEGEANKTADGEFFTVDVERGEIVLRVRKFSDYAIAETPPGVRVGEKAYALVADRICTISGTGVATNFPATFGFDDRNSITNAVVADGITEIGARFFKNCNNLNTLKVGKDVAKFGEKAFLYCMSLETIEIENPDFDLSCLDGAISYHTAIKPDGSLYPIPSVTVNGYQQTLEGKAALTDASWTDLGAVVPGKPMSEYGDYHFFRIVLKKVE